MSWQATGVVATTLAEGALRELLLDGRSVVLTRLGGSIVAFDGYCPHQGGLLVEGRLAAGRIVCPVHEAAFDPVSGEVRADPFGTEPPAGGVAPLPTFRVRLAGGSVEVELPEPPR